MKFPPFLHSHLRLTLLGTPPNRVFFVWSEIGTIWRTLPLFWCLWIIGLKPQAAEKPPGCEVRANIETFSSGVRIHTFGSSIFFGSALVRPPEAGNYRDMVLNLNSPGPEPHPHINLSGWRNIDTSLFVHLLRTVMVEFVGFRWWFSTRQIGFEKLPSLSCFPESETRPFRAFSIYITRSLYRAWCVEPQ